MTQQLMTPPLGERILLLVEASGIEGSTPTARARALARLYGLAPDFFADFLCAPPRKKSFSQENLFRAAAALGCDVGYLTGEQSTPRAEINGRPEVFPSLIRLSGKCMTGVWHSKEALEHEVLPIVPISPDPRFINLPSVGYVAFGSGMAGLGVTDHCFVVGSPYAEVIKVQPLRVGDLVVLRRERDELGEVEISLRVVVSTSPSLVFEARPSKPELRFPPISLSDPPAGERVTILAVVWRAVKLFGIGDMPPHLMSL